MACEYYSRVEAATFTDSKILGKAMERLKARRGSYRVNGLQVEAETRQDMDALKQAYSTETARAALKAKGFFVAERKDAKTGKILLTVQA